MSADSFHHQVEKVCQQMGSLYDFEDFIKACNETDRAIPVNPGDFFKWEKQLSEGKVSKATRPYLDQVMVAKFEKGSMELHYKLSHTDPD